MRAALFANGIIDDYSLVAAKIGNIHTAIAVDGGLSHCYALGITPHIHVGDMDSVDPEILFACPPLSSKVYPNDKDESDLEVALDLLNFEEYEDVVVAGATGGGTDHILGNLYLLERYPNSLSFISEIERHLVIQNQMTIRTNPGMKISLFPLFGNASIKSTQGLKWPIEETVLDKTYFSLSNEATQEEISFDISKGKVLLILSDR